MEGKVEGLFLGPDEDGAIQSPTELLAVAGKGIEGDRYFGSGVPAEEITLFPREGLDGARDEIDVEPKEMRRNVMTSGVDLTALIGKKVVVGEVEIEVLKENPPCKHLESLAGKPLLKPLINFGGVRGRIVKGGTIRIGDAIVADN